MKGRNAKEAKFSSLFIRLTLHFETGPAHHTLGLCRDPGIVQYLALPDHQGVAQAVAGRLETVPSGNGLVVHEPHQLNVFGCHDALEGGVLAL